ncbi:MAG: LCP family protein [Desulfosporosinus sp.]|nr:LCP family protein [Desulfosporosinus sp.]
MQGNKNAGKAISRVFKVYTKLKLFSFFLCVGLVLGAILVSLVVGDKNHVLVGNKQEVEELGKIPGEPQVETGPQNDSTGDNFNDTGETLAESKRFTVLLVGVDRRPGETSLSNTDSLIVVSMNTDNGKVALISIPRDTQVVIPGYGTTKINAAARVGKGYKTTIALIEGLTGQPIDGYILTNFAGFKSIIDTMGGITVTVEKDMHYVTGDRVDGVINLAKGTQRLNGTQALQYARFRQDALADIARTVRQQTILKAMGKEFMKVKTMAKLPWLIPQIAKSVQTNLSVGQLWSLANVLLQFERPEISSQTLPGNFLIENDISYWKVNPQTARAVVKRLFEEGKTSSMFFGT